MKRTKEINSIKGVLRPYWPRIVLLCVMTLAQSVLQVSVALLSSYVIDAALKGSDTLAVWSVILIADIVLQVILYAAINWFTGSITDHFATDLRFRLLRSALHSSDAALGEYHSGQLLSRGMEDVYTVCDGIVYAVPTLVGQLSRLIAAFAVVFLIYPSVAGVLCMVAVAVLIAVALLRPVLKSKHRAVRKADEKVMSTMQEDLQQLELIQSLDARDQILNRFDKRLKKSLKAKFNRRIWTVGNSTVLGAASLLGSGVLLLWGINKVAAGALTYGSMTALFQLLSHFRTPVLSLSGLWTRITGIEVACERLAVMMEVSEKPKPVEDINAHAVVFENVTFRYNSDEAAVLENFSVRFPLDGWSCLTGISGRGKTTLFKLMLGLYTPQSGRVYLQTEKGQIPCSEQTRHLFAYVPQDYALFSGTILDNLLLVAPDADEQQRRRALEIAQADFVWDMTTGEQTLLRENNTGLSKGQLQRIAIARAILMDRPVLLLDECTSALDAQTEKAVLDKLHKLGKHAIFVTHRPEALEGMEGITSVSMEAE